MTRSCVVRATALSAVIVYALFSVMVSAGSVYAAATHQSSRCSTFRIQGHKYGVYIADGHLKCAVAVGILKAVQGGAGQAISGGSSANSYVLYGGWLCPDGNMGEQTCEHSTHPVSHPHQDIASLACAAFPEGCPKRAAFANE